MMQNDSEWIKDLFAATTCDWTPPSAHRVACVLYAPVSRDPETSTRCASILTEVERQRADRFITEDGKRNFKQRRAFRRYCGAVALGSQELLSRVDFKETEKGRPYLPDLPDVRFSFSSCKFGFLGAWSWTHRIGVDIEDQTRDLEEVELARRYFSAGEARAVMTADAFARRRTFCQLWNLKEAALKSIGEGLHFGLDTFEFELMSNVRVVHAPLDHGGWERFDAHIIERPYLCAALVVAAWPDIPNDLPCPRDGSPGFRRGRTETLPVAPT